MGAHVEPGGEAMQMRTCTKANDGSPGSLLLFRCLLWIAPKPRHRGAPTDPIRETELI